jgi:putative ABC transport system substrate-binding protein
VVLLAIGVIAEAQQPKKVPRIGFLSVASQSSLASRVQVFNQGLRELGYVESQNIMIDYRWGAGTDELLPGLAAELVHLKVDVIVAHGTLAVLAAKKAESTLPIICFACGDLVSTKLVASLARPGGTVTGLTLIAPEVSGKRLELLREIVPRLNRVAVLLNPGNPVSGPELNETEEAARSMGLRLQSFRASDPDGFHSAFASMKRERSGALIVLSDAMLYGWREQIATLAASNRLPAISWSGEFAASGGLMAYGPDVFALARRAAMYVDKILKGANPANLPVEQPMKFELVINLKTAKQIGVTIPQSVLYRADKVIK